MMKRSGNRMWPFLYGVLLAIAPAITADIGKTPSAGIPQSKTSLFNGSPYVWFDKMGRYVVDYDVERGVTASFPCPACASEDLARIREYVSRISALFANAEQEYRRKKAGAPIKGFESFTVSHLDTMLLPGEYKCSYLEPNSHWKALQIHPAQASEAHMALTFAPIGTVDSYEGDVPGITGEVTVLFSEGEKFRQVNERQGPKSAQWVISTHFDSNGEPEDAWCKTRYTVCRDVDEAKLSLDVETDRQKWMQSTESRFAHGPGLSDEESEKRLAIIRQYVSVGKGDMDAFRALVARNSTEAARNGFTPLDIKRDLFLFSFPGPPLADSKDMILSKLFELYGDVLTAQELTELMLAWSNEPRVIEFMWKYKIQFLKAVAEGPVGEPIPQGSGNVHTQQNP